MPSDRDRPDEDLDAAFAAIIAGWDDIPSLDDPDDRAAGTGSGPVAPRRRASDDVGGDTQPPASPDGRSAAPGAPTQPSVPASHERRPRDPSEIAGPRDWAAAEDEDDDRYHPPEPPPLPRGDLVGRLAWAGVLLGPTFLLVAGLFWRDAPRLWLGLAVLGFVGGFVTLVLRLPADRDPYDGDDGAVV
jgi:hypothetical protein